MVELESYDAVNSLAVLMCAEPVTENAERVLSVVVVAVYVLKMFVD